jgi:multidrug efflux pump subunit AcrB
MSQSQDHRGGITGRIVEAFLRGNLSGMLIVIAVVCGLAAVLLTPREEEPQIVVPMADVMIQVPGASAQEVERQVSTRIEKILYQIDGVEYVYSMSKPGLAIVTVRFYVGEDRIGSLVKLYNQINMNMDQVPATVAGWVVKPVETDDVPILNITFYSDRYDADNLRRVAEEVGIRLQAADINTGRTYIVGGEPLQVRITPDPELMASRNISVLQIATALKGANVTVPANFLKGHDTVQTAEAGTTFHNLDDVRHLVVGVALGQPVYLQDIAKVEQAPAEQSNYTRLMFGPAAEERDFPSDLSEARTNDWPAVTLAIAKKKDRNAVWVSENVQAELEKLKGSIIPGDIHTLVTRDYGETANDKVNELLEGLLVAIVIVIGLIFVTLGGREAFIVAVAVPITFALTLLINYLAGYTINRVTLFALTLSLGLVVDDPIVDVENIYRHLRMRKEKPLQAVLSAVNEVRPPIILATLAVIVSFIPMFFITGMMGPYMRPMALNVPLAMLMSLVVAFTITPWMSYHLLKGRYEHPAAKEEEPADLHRTLIYRIYNGVLRPLLDSRLLAGLLLGITALLFVGAIGLVMARKVPLKMLPFDNKNEFQLVVDMPEGTSLERTEAATAALADYLRTVPEVRNITTYVGAASPMDFNSMVRHYYLRQASHMADIRVNLVHKKQREAQSHDIVLRIRKPIAELAQATGANVKIVEAPPGPPVISTVTVEVYGQDYNTYDQVQQASQIVAERLGREDGVVDLDTSAEAAQGKWTFVTDKEKAALAGVSTEQVAQALAMGVSGQSVSVMHRPGEVNPMPIWVQLSRSLRDDPRSLNRLYVTGSQGQVIPLDEIGRWEQHVEDQTIYRKNLRPVAYVFAEMAGRAPGEAIFETWKDLKAHPLPEGFEAVWTGEGEWNITVDVFRDLGIAFGAACIGIYILLVYETGSYLMPLILMLAIPLTIIGIMPGFALLNVLWDQPIGGFNNPIFFTATAMIGMIALAGIVVRNAILLIEFIHSSVADGVPLREALIDSGAIRFRAIFLTAGTSILAAIPITLDPIFSGLAWSFIFGLFVSTAFTLLIVPVVYWIVYGRKERKAAKHPVPVAAGRTNGNAKNV